MEQVNNENRSAESGGGHGNKGSRLTKRDVIGGIALVIFVAGALSGYYAYNHISKESARMQFWVSFMFSFAAFVVLLVQSVIYAQQAEFMRQQSQAMHGALDETRKVVAQNERIVRTMRGQLDAMKLQEGHMQSQSAAMIGQLKVMEDGLKATRESVDLTWEGLKTQKRAYLSTNRMNIDLAAKQRLAIYLINVGKNPATNVIAKVQVTITTPFEWHKQQPEQVRTFAVGEQEYKFNLTAIYPDSIPVRIGFPLGRHFSPQELTLVAQKKSQLIVDLTIDYEDGFEKGFSYFALTYRGKDSRGNDSWGIFPTESEKEYDKTNPENPEWRVY